MRRLLIYQFIFICIVGSSFGAFKFLESLKKDVENKPKLELGVLVDTSTATPYLDPLTITAYGTVQAAQQIDLVPQVSGEIISLCPDMVLGGFCKQGTELFAIDPTDYELAVEQAKAVVAKAQYELLLMEAQATAAARDWRTVQANSTETMSIPDPLVMFQPQLKLAQASLSAANATLKKAEINLGRTKIVAPFNLRVLQENLDLGQYLRAGNPVASLIASDKLEVIVQLPLADLEWLNVPGLHSKLGSHAKVIVHTGKSSHQWMGTINRSLAAVESNSRMISLVVVVDDPYAQAKYELRLNDYVEVQFIGKRLQNSLQLPISALRANDTVWLNVDGKLEFRQVNVVKKLQSHFLIDKGVSTTDKVVVSTVPGAVTGMLLRDYVATESSKEPIKNNTDKE